MQAYEVVTNAERLAAIAVEVEQRPVSALDLETTALSPRDGEIRIISLNTGSGRYVIDLFQTKTMGPLVPALNKTKGVIVGQNLKFDQKWLLWKHMVELEKVFDTFRSSSILYNGYQHVSHDLYDLFRRELKISPEAHELGGSDWSGALSKEQLDYAAEDIIHLPALRETLIPKLKASGLLKIAGIEFQAILPEAAIELNGFWLDSERWLDVARHNEAKYRASRALLMSELPYPKKQMLLPGFEDLLPQKVGRGRRDADGVFEKEGTFNKKLFNLDSPEQVLESLRLLGLTQKVYNKELQRSETVELQDTKEMTLAMLAGQYPIVSKFIEFRGYSQRRKSFGEDYLEHISEQTGRIHTEFWPFTGAGRYASSDPNLQQIPREKVYRECFRAPPGRRLAIADYSNIEMRIVAEISGDKLLIQVFNDPKGDAHRTTASLLAGVEPKLVSKDQRQQAKPVNFGFIYGMQPPRLVLYARANYGVTLTEGQAIKFRRKFFEAYHGVATWHEFVQREAQRLKMARTIWGRRRFLDPETAFNEFYNTPVQGCLSEDARVLLDRGYTTIKDVKVLGTKGKKVWTGSEWAEFELLDRGRSPRADLYLKDGTRLPADTRHKLLVVRDTGYEWTDFKVLKLGDKVAQSLAKPQESLLPPQPLPDLKRGKRTRLKTVRNGTEGDLWYWLGYYFGDGWKSSKESCLSYVFGLHERARLKECKVFWEGWGVHPKEQRATHKPARKVSTRYRLDIYSADLVRWLGEVGIEDATAHTKRLPGRIFTESLANRRRFVQGFMASDGYFPERSQGGPNLHLCQRPLLEDVKLLLRSLGVESCLRGPQVYNDEVSYRLDIHGAMYFREVQGEVVRGPQFGAMDAPLFLLNELRTKYPKLRTTAFPSRTAYTLWRRVVSGGTLSVYTLDSLCRQMGWELSQPIYAYRELVKIQELTEDATTYTLSVKDPKHRFDAEGVITKNSGADGLKNSLRIVYRRFKKLSGGEVLLARGARAGMVHMVHDELVGEHADEGPEFDLVVRRELEEGMIEGMAPMLKRVATACEAGGGPSWADKS